VAGAAAYAGLVSNVVHAFWPRFYGTLARFDPLIEWFWRRFGIGNVVRVVIVGRRTGHRRQLFLGVLRVLDREYVGHPDLACAWTRNLEAAGGGVLEEHDGRLRSFTITILEPGPERDAVIRATFTQHPFPGGAIYWLLRGHVRSSGRFYRLTFDRMAV
jgi:hypothetical protein